MAGVMLDTNIYTDGSYMENVSRIRSLYISSVVIQELLVIAKREQQVALIREFREKLNSGTGIVPDEMDWMEVGKCLSRLYQTGTANFTKLSKIEVNMLFRDALIARTAMRANAVLITSNTDDFSKIKAVFASLKFKSPAEFFGLRQR